ncbi:MAG: hypothetical protein ACJ79E_15050, partial [Anaeromyxobacteraceae bacterium]
MRGAVLIVAGVAFAWGPFDSGRSAAYAQGERLGDPTVRPERSAAESKGDAPPSAPPSPATSTRTLHLPLTEAQR